MEQKLKEKQPQHSGFQRAAGEPDEMSTSCLMPMTKRSDTEEKLTTELEKPITVHTSKPDSRQSRFWRLNHQQEDSDCKLNSSCYECLSFHLTFFLH